MISELRVREAIEEREESLSPHAAKSRQSRGRERHEEPCPVRTAFQRDRDRIIHCNAFRRLKHKTQVFIAPQGDHYITRLTHTLEVSQIARTIARSLDLNEDLTEAIALGHDLGHTPFGHVGEDELNELYEQGFRHNEQSLRVVDLLENDGQGLNLTWEVRDGILNHSKSTSGVLHNWGKIGTLEGEVARLADFAAYVNHDIDDAIRAGLITREDLPPAAVAVLGCSHSERVNTLVCDVIERSWRVRTAGKTGSPAIVLGPEVLQAAGLLRAFLFERVYNLESSGKEARKARTTLRRLHRYFLRRPGELPPELASTGDNTERQVIDYIAGMTDQFAEKLARGLAGR